MYEFRWPLCGIGDERIADFALGWGTFVLDDRYIAITVEDAAEAAYLMQHMVETVPEYLFTIRSDGEEVAFGNVFNFLSDAVTALVP